MAELIDELRPLKDARRKKCERIKSLGLPIVIFGAGEMARLITEELNSFGVSIDGYAVDEKYFSPDQKYLGRPIYNFDRMARDNYVFVLGINDEHSDGRRAIAFLRDAGITRFAMTCTFFVEPIDFDYVFEHRAEFEATFEMLDDELSRRTMINFLKLKFGGDPKYNLEVFDPDQYFNGLTERIGSGACVDCGAYRGDTIEKFIERYGVERKIFAVEADPKNFAELERFVRERGYENVRLFNCGVWNERTTLSFNAERLDDLIGDERVSFIKADVEGSELNALEGAARIIRRDHPTLTVCVYHKSADLITIPRRIKTLRADYKFYLRKHTRLMDNELVLYAIPIGG